MQSTVKATDPQHWSDQQKTEYVRREVTAAGVALRERHTWLRHQDAIGAAIMIGSLGGMLACAWAYAAGHLALWLCIPMVAIFASFTHELEHDLIHRMYFRNRPWAHNLMMLAGWIARPSTINPWIRRHLHLHHHKHSGTETDLEERGITNGERWGLLRMVMLFDGILAIVLRLHRAPNARLRARMLIRGLIAYFPLGWLHWGTWYVFLGFHGGNLVASTMGTQIGWSADTVAMMAVVNLVTAVWIAPNLLRSFCLHFVSSNMHYYGDVEDGNVVQQTQVMQPRWMLPFQLFCFNFGSTHAIHHFVVKEPFYVRQATAATGHRVLREIGVRFNDTGSFARANRYTRSVPA